MLNTRIVAFVCAVLTCGALLLRSGAAPEPSASPAKSESTAKKSKIAQLLFVQNAGGVSSTEGKITLHDVEEITVCFSDLQCGGPGTC